MRGDCINITILVDSREKKNQHILSYFDKRQIPYKVKKLDFADYSFEIDGVSYGNEYSIERKANLNELSGNFTQQRERFAREFERSNGKITLLIEDSSLNDVLTHNYDTQLTEKSYIASLFTFQHRYNLDVNFIDKKFSGLFIYHQFYYYAKAKGLLVEKVS